MFLVQIPIATETGYHGVVYLNPETVAVVDEVDPHRVNPGQADTKSRITLVTGRFYLSPLTIEEVDKLFEDWEAQA